MNTEKTFIHLEDLNDGSLSLSVNGDGGSLIEMLSNAISQSGDFRVIVEMALVQVITCEHEDHQSEDDQLVEMLSKMKIGLA